MKSFNNALIYVEGKGIVRTNLSFDDKIISIDDKKSFDNGIDIPQDAIVVPGFIDEHIHGAMGYDAMDGTIDAFHSISKALVKEGTTTFLATTMTVAEDKIKTSLKNINEFCKMNYNDGATLLGVHLEGPFISVKFKGAQAEESIKQPDIKLIDEFSAISGNRIKIVTLAPECEGATDFIKHITSNGIVASMGHSSAGYQDVINGMNAGATNITHTYNAQSPLHHREIGVVGSALLIDGLRTELIADTIHVSVPAIKVLLKNKPKDKVILITDSMRAKGLSDGISELGGQKVIVKNGEARLENGTLAGSILKMNVAVKNMVEKVGVKIEDAIDFATINPAKSLGIENKVGSIKIGKNADFTILDKDFNVIKTIINGKEMF